MNLIEKLDRLYKERYMEHIDIDIWNKAIEESWPQISNMLWHALKPKIFEPAKVTMNLIEKLDELEKSATPGPWIVDMGNGQIESEHEDHYRIEIVNRADIQERIDTYERLESKQKQFHPDCDLDFITELRNAWPKLREIIKNAQYVAAISSTSNMLGFEEITRGIGGTMKLIEELDRLEKIAQEGGWHGDHQVWINRLEDAWPKLRAAVLLFKDERVAWNEDYCSGTEFDELDEFRKERLKLLAELDQP